MLHAIAHFFSGFPPALVVFLVSMVPLLEHRASLPLAILVYHMPVWLAFTLSFFGSLIPVTILLYYADMFHAWVKRNAHTYWGSRWLLKLKQAQDGFAKYEKYGLIGLTLFIILPLPGSGIFTGTMLAFLLGIPFRRSWPFIAGAVAGSAMVAILLSIGAGRLF